MTDGNDIIFTFGDSCDITTNYFISEYCFPCKLQLIKQYFMINFLPNILLQ